MSNVQSNDKRQAHRHFMPVRGLAQGTKSACPSWCRTSADRESSANKPESSTNCDAAETLSSWFHSNILDKTCNCRCHDQRGMLCYCMLWALQSHYNHRFWFWRSGERLVVVWPEAASTVGWERRSPRRNLLVPWVDHCVDHWMLVISDRHQSWLSDVVGVSTKT